jgi:hypothetical protein
MVLIPRLEWRPAPHAAPDDPGLLSVGRLIDDDTQLHTDDATTSLGSS